MRFSTSAVAAASLLALSAIPAQAQPTTRLALALHQSSGRDLPDRTPISGSRFWHWRALVGAVLAVGGAYTAPGSAGPFPAGGLLPFLKALYDYSWVAGLAGGFLVYLALALPGRAADARETE